MHALVVVRSRAATLSHALINLSRDSLIISIWELSEKDKMAIQHFPLRPSKIKLAKTEELLVFICCTNWYTNLA